MTKGDIQEKLDSRHAPPTRSAEAQPGLSTPGQSIGESLPCLICLLDADARVVRMSRAAERWGLGASGSLSNRTFHELLHPLCEADSCRLAQVLADCSSSASRTQECEARLRLGAMQRYLELMVWGLPGSAQIDRAVAIVVLTDLNMPNSAHESLCVLESTIGTETHATLSRSRDEFAALARQLIEAQELERQHLAGQLQSVIGPALDATKFELERGNALLRTSRHHDFPPVLLRATTSLQASIDDIRNLATGLRPAVLDDLGPLAAIDWYCREFSQANPAIEVGQRICVLPAEMPQQLGTPIFRCVQHLLNGMREHLRVHRIVVLLTRESEQLVLEILNDGVAIGGFDGKPSFPRHSWILAARMQAQISNGQLSVLPGGMGFCSRVRVEWSLCAEEVSQPGHGPESTVER